MRKLLVVVLVLLAIGLLAAAVYYSFMQVRAPASNVDSGGQAQVIDVNTYQCSTQDPAQCDCERTAVASGMGVEAARAGCAQ